MSADYFCNCYKCGYAMPPSTCHLCKECWSDKYQPKKGTKFMDQYAHLRHLYPRAGATWDQAEDNQLVEELCAGTLYSSIARKHGRTVGAIIARVEKLTEEAQTRTAFKQADNGPWTAALRQMLEVSRETEKALRAENGKLHAVVSEQARSIAKLCDERDTARSKAADIQAKHSALLNAMYRLSVS